MRNLIFVLAIGFIVGCGGASKENPDGTNDSLSQIKPSDTLDALFNIKDEKQLKEVYGEQNVAWDTIWGGEGEFTMGTVLYAGTPDNVVVEWENPDKKEKVIALIHECQYNMEADRHDLKSRWLTRSGVKLGMSLTDLVKINEKDFTFYGLGWDYGGGVINWNGGNLSKYNIFVTLGIDDMPDDKRKSFDKICGDSEFKSDNPDARNLNPLVFEIILSKD